MSEAADGAEDDLDARTLEVRKLCQTGEHVWCGLALGMTLEDLLGPHDGPETHRADHFVTQCFGETTAEWLARH